MEMTRLSKREGALLLEIARKSLELAVREGKQLKLDLTDLPPVLQKDGASFVTLTIHGRLRGCIGSLEAYQPLALDVRDRAIHAALEDPRFNPVSVSELQEIKVEVSYLTEPKQFPYQSPADLLEGLRPGVDGVVLRSGRRSATFLPQVWEQLPNPADFLSQLCLKMGARADAWKTEKPEVSRYQVMEFHEE